MDLTNNQVRIAGAMDLSWVDTRIEDNLFVREFNNNTFYVENGKIIVKTKVIPAKPFDTLQKDKKLMKSDNFMTLDIETMLVDGIHYPYLICGYGANFEISSFVDPETVRNGGPYREKMFNEFIAKLLEQKKINYVYAHNLGSFDGIILLKYLMLTPVLILNH